MLGVYMQRSWIILLTTACLLVPIYIWSPPILELFGETTEISNAAGCNFALFLKENRQKINNQPELTKDEEK